MNSFARRLAAVAGAAVIGLGIAAPAHAASYTRTDARGDVTASTACDSSGSNCTDVIDATRTDPDVLRTVMTHGRYRVNFAVTFSDLAVAGSSVYLARIVTNEGLHRHYSILTQDGHIIFSELDRDRDGRKVACSGIRRSVDHARNTVSISIPRACLSRPRSVRLGFGAMDMKDFLDPSQGYYADDALTSTVVSSNTQDVVLGPVLKRA